MAGGALGLIANLAYNQARFGDPLETGSREVALHCTGSDRVAVLFSHSIPQGLASYLVSPQRGLAWFAPLVLAAAWGWPGLARRAPLATAALLAATLAETVVYAAFVGWHGAWCWGPRYILCLSAVLTLPLAEVIERGPPAARRGALALAVAGLLLQLPPVALNYHRSYYRALVERRDFTSPWWPQPLVQLAEAAAVLAHGRPTELDFHPPTAMPPAERLERAATLNLPDCWWALALALGTSPALVALALAGPLATGALAGRALVNALARGADE